MKRALLILAFYGLLAFLALHTPLFNIETHVPGTPTTDYYHFHWNYWWMRHAITQGLPIYETNYVFFPYSNNLAYHTLTPFWFPVWAVLEPLIGTVGAVSGIMLTAFTLNGAVLYTLLRTEGVNMGLALIGGVMLELSSMMFTAAFWTNLNLMNWFWLPALILLWKRIYSTRRPRPQLQWAVIFGVALWAMVLCDLQYPLFAAFLVVPYGLLTIWQTKSNVARLQLIGIGIIAMIVAVTLLWFVGPLPYILSFDRGGLTSTPVESAVSIPFPLGYLWHTDTGTPVGVLLLPGIILALSLSFRTRTTLPKIRWLWLALVAVPLTLSVGGSIRIGSADIPMPYTLLHQALGGMFRYPERFLPVFTIPALLFIGITLTALLNDRPRVRRWLPAGILLLILIDSQTLRSLPIQPLPPTYAFYEAMGNEPYDYVVVESPTGASSGETLIGESPYSTLMFYGITHGKRMINGHLARVNIDHVWYLRTDDPLLSWLGQRRFIEPEVVEAHMQEMITEYPIGYFVIHGDLIGRETVAYQEIIGYFNSAHDLVCPMYIEGAAVAYRTTWHPDGCPLRTPPQTEANVYRIDIGSADDVRYIGWGWHYAEEILPGLNVRWLGRHPQTKVYVDLPSGAYELHFSAQAFNTPRTVRVSVNSYYVGQAQVSHTGLSEFTFPITPNWIGEGTQIELQFDYTAPQSPAELGLGADQRQLALMMDWIEFRQTAPATLGE